MGNVVLRCPRNSASEYFNHKNAFSIVLLALVDANYNFMFVNAGCQGGISDSGVFTNTELYKKKKLAALSMLHKAKKAYYACDVIRFFVP